MNNRRQIYEFICTKPPSRRTFFVYLSTYGNNRPKITAVGKGINSLPKIRPVLSDNKFMKECANYNVRKWKINKNFAYICNVLSVSKRAGRLPKMSNYGPEVLSKNVFD